MLYCILLTLVSVAARLLFAQPFLAGFLPALTGLVSGLITVFVGTLFSFILALIIDKNYGWFGSFAASAKLVAPRWLRLFVLHMIAIVLVGLAFVPLAASLWSNSSILHLLGIAFAVIYGVWAIPYAMLINGVAYHKIVDVASEEEQS